MRVCAVIICMCYYKHVIKTVLLNCVIYKQIKHVAVQLAFVVNPKQEYEQGEPWRAAQVLVSSKCSATSPQQLHQEIRLLSDTHQHCLAVARTVQCVIGIAVAPVHALCCMFFSQT